MKPKLTTISVTKALTFIELLIVVIIIGILAIAAVPQFRKTFDSLELDNFSRDIYYLSRYLQETAIGESRTYILNVDTQAKEIQACYKENGDLIPLSGRFGNKYHAPGKSEISLEPADKTAIWFYPDGSTDKVTLSIEEGQYNKTITLIYGKTSGVKIQ